jgi:hypothetical protein
MKAAVCVLASAIFCSAAQAAPADNLRDLFAQFRACLTLPAGSPSAEITLRFSLRRDGGLIGKPHITFARLPPGEALQGAALEAVAAAFDHCLPARMTDALGGAVAGRPLTLRLISGGREQGV